MGEAVFYTKAGENIMDTIQRLAALRGAETSPEYREYEKWRLIWDGDDDFDENDIKHYEDELEAVLDALAEQYDGVTFYAFPEERNELENGYNGWSSFETWRVFSDFLHDAPDRFARFPEEYTSTIDLGRDFKSYVSNLHDSLKTLTNISGSESEKRLTEYARFFIERADYQEIAENVWDEYKEARKEVHTEG